MRERMTEKQSFLEVLAQPWILDGHNVVLAALGWTVVQLVSNSIIRSVAPEDPKKRDDRGVRVCAMIHALVACTLSLTALFEADSPMHKDRISGVSSTSHLLHIISVGCVCMCSRVCVLCGKIVLYFCYSVVFFTV